MTRHYDGNPEHPFREVLEAITGVKAPKFVRGYCTRGYTDAEQMELQDWAASNAKPSWGTGIGLIEAAEHMVAEAVSNANIPPDPNEPKRVERFVDINGDRLEIFNLDGRIRIAWDYQPAALYLEEGIGAEDSLLSIATQAAKPFAIEGSVVLTFKDQATAQQALDAANTALFEAAPDEAYDSDDEDEWG